VNPLAAAGVTAVFVCASAAQAGSWLGDAGHFLNSRPDIFIHNPGNQEFAVTVHRHVWPADWGNGAPGAAATNRVFSPSGTCVGTGLLASTAERVVIAVPATGAGVYRLEIATPGYPLMWVECTLDRMVAACGDWEVRDGPFKTFILHAMAPRRWYFHVPAGTKRFEVKHTVFPFQSHREDYGFLVMNPRGQRVEAFYGGKPLAVETVTPNVPIPVVRAVETDAGTDGRFWSIWATGGDSHSFSDLQILVNGVPPYYASCPEQWFDPRTRAVAPTCVYDDAPVRLRDRKDEQGNPVSRDHYFWAPSTFLGDEDYNGWRGPQTLFLSNPANRALDLGVETYIADNAARFPVACKIAAPDGKTVVDARGEYGHHLSHRFSIPASGAGTYRVDIDAGRWFPWTEPTTPIVIAGKPVAGGAGRFELETGIARHWFLRVPAGVERFSVAVSVKSPDHVLLLEVHAPDRMMDVLYVGGGAPRSVAIPCRRSCRPDLVPAHGGRSATRFTSDKGRPAHNRIEADIDLAGVPPYLAPTWEQWFLPEALRGERYARRGAGLPNHAGTGWPRRGQVRLVRTRRTATCNSHSSESPQNLAADRSRW